MLRVSSFKWFYHWLYHWLGKIFIGKKSPPSIIWSLVPNVVQPTPSSPTNSHKFAQKSLYPMKRFFFCWKTSLHTLRGEILCHYEKWFDNDLANLIGVCHQNGFASLQIDHCSYCYLFQSPRQSVKTKSHNYTRKLWNHKTSSNLFHKKQTISRSFLYYHSRLSQLSSFCHGYHFILKAISFLY